MDDIIKVHTIYSNVSYDPEFISDWGFSCVIDYNGQRILFDTGAKADILEYNLKKASIEPSSINTIIISHNHWDHTGGFNWITEQAINCEKIYLPQTLCEFELKDANSSKINIIESNTKIGDNIFCIFSKNILISELSLVIKLKKGSIIFTGCSHTGIENIVNSTISSLNYRIFAVMGGFHMYKSFKSNIRKTVKTLKDLDVDIIIPCHCTGEDATEIFKGLFADNCIINGVGRELEFSDI